MSETGSGIDGVSEASTLTVTDVTVGAVQAREEQSQAIVLIVTAIVLVVPALSDQSSKVVVIVRVSEIEEEIWLP